DALKLEGQNWEAHYNLALALLKMGNRTGAKQELQAAIQHKPDSVSSHFALGSLFESDNKSDEAAEEFKAALKIDPHFVPASLKLSHVLTNQGKMPAAIACLEDGLKQAPSVDEEEALQASLGLAYAESGDPKKGLEVLSSLVAKQPNSADAHFSLGLLYGKSSQPGDQDLAAAQFREALRLDTNNDSARLALGCLLVSRGKCSDSMPPLLEYVKNRPNDGQGVHALGLACKCLGRVNDAMNALKRAVRLDPKIADIHYDLGLTLAQAARSAEAIQELKAAAQFDPANPEPHQQLALLLERAGNKEGALAESAKIKILRTREGSQAAAGRFNAEANQFLLDVNAT